MGDVGGTSVKSLVRYENLGSLNAYEFPVLNTAGSLSAADNGQSTHPCSCHEKAS
jgi:hypothetical protein